MHIFFTYSSIRSKPNENMRLVVVTIVGAVFGFLIGISFPTVNITKVRACSVNTQHLGNNMYLNDPNKNAAASLSI